MGRRADGTARCRSAAQPTMSGGTSRSSRSSTPQPQRLSRSRRSGRTPLALAALAGEHGDGTYRADAAGGRRARRRRRERRRTSRPCEPRSARGRPASCAGTGERAGRMRRSRPSARVPPVSTYSTLTDAELVEPVPGRRSGRLERARRALLAVRLRDRRSGLPTERRGCRGRLPGCLHADLHAPRQPPGRLRATTLDRPAHTPPLPRCDRREARAPGRRRGAGGGHRPI